MSSNKCHFLETLLNILQSQIYSDIIQWTEDGQGIVILDRTRLEKRILDYYFSQKHYRSFTKQMNLYKFNTTKDQNGNSVFVNDNFRKKKQNFNLIIQSKKIKKQTKWEPYDVQKELDELRIQIKLLLTNQQQLQQQIFQQLQIQKQFIIILDFLQYKFTIKKEIGLYRRHKINEAFNLLIGNIQSPIIGIQSYYQKALKFLILNHDLLCQCANTDSQCKSYIFSRSICATPIVTPNLLQMWNYRQENSIRLIQEKLVDDDKTKRFLSLSKEQQDSFVENIWSE